MTDLWLLLEITPGELHDYGDLGSWAEEDKYEALIAGKTKEDLVEYAKQFGGDQSWDGKYLTVVREKLRCTLTYEYIALPVNFGEQIVY